MPCAKKASKKPELVRNNNNPLCACVFCLRDVASLWSFMPFLSQVSRVNRFFGAGLGERHPGGPAVAAGTPGPAHQPQQGAGI